MKKCGEISVIQEMKHLSGNEEAIKKSGNEGGVRKCRESSVVLGILTKHGCACASFLLKVRAPSLLMNNS